MRFGENALGVINRVKEKIEEVRGSLPEGVEIVPVYDRSDLIYRSVRNLEEKLMEESLIVSLVCIIFLFHFRSALVAILVLPIAILMSLLGMKFLGLNSNIMSLGGIAIAIGTMIDSAIIMIENAHKKLEHWEAEGRPGERSRVLIDAAKEVGRPLFFSLLIIAVSFLPVFTLEAQEGRLFKPLAYTKTFAMLAASFLSVFLVPTLMLLLIRGKIAPEGKNPINRFLIWVYRPFVHLVLRFQKSTLVVAVLLVATSVPVFSKLGSEFMPPLYEGSLLFMPTGLPGMSIDSVSRTMQLQDKILKKFPEVETVFGKAGRARTATDPAPLSMIETTITLKPESEWREGMTPEKLVEEMNQALRIPGISNSWTMPIKCRIDMLTTGIRTPVGIKVFGPDLQVVEQIGGQLEQALKDVPGTRNIYAERVAGGYFMDFTVNRQAAARYGLTVGDVEDVIESAIGGKNVTMTVEGRERYPVNVRYKRELRQDPAQLRRVLVATPTGAQVPLAQLADLKFTMGPPVIKTEAAEPVGYVFVDVAGRDIGGYVEEAIRTVEEKVKIPMGYHLTWSGQYEYMQRARERMFYVVPLTLFIVFLLLYLNMKSLTKVFIVLLAVPFSLIGAVWVLYALDYNMSVAVWVGIIALLGVDAETGVIMLLYLDHAYERMKGAGRMRSLEDLKEAVMEGAVLRVRPKMMTVMAIVMGLLPIMWSSGAGSDVMKRIAAPMIGGILTSFVLELLVYPVIFTLWKWHGEVKSSRKEFAAL